LRELGFIKELGAARRFLIGKGWEDRVLCDAAAVLAAKPVLISY